MTKRSGTGRTRAGRRTVEFSNPGKVLFPEDAITKADLVAYYVRMAPLIVPHTRGRPAMLHRFPDGIARPGFYQKDVSDHFPAWVRRVEVAKRGGTVVHPLPDDAATLAYLAGQASVTLHCWTSRADRLDRPDQLIFDLDPSAPGDPGGAAAGAGFAVAVDTARRLRDLLGELGLAAFVKTTGSKGLHVVSPLVRRHGYDAVGAFAAGVAELLARRDPDRLTTEFLTRERRGRLYLDVARNRRAQTAVVPYAVRALPGAPVATPVAWAELDDASFGPRRWTLRTVAERAEAAGDPWAGMRRRARSLSEPGRRLAALLGTGP